MRYWFRPKRFWGFFAMYVPSAPAGWFATLILLTLAFFLFLSIDTNAHSAGDLIFTFAPWGILLLVLFDLLCFRFGEYPSWWRKREHRSKR